jgi:hypothetical protein
VTRNGEPIEAIAPRRRVDTGIAYDDVRRELGWISEYEERDVAQAYNYRWDEWLATPVIEREAAVAHSRIHSLIQLHANEAVAEQQKRDTERERRKRQSRED